MKFENLFSPVLIRTVEIPNRFTVPAMVMNYCREDGYPTEQYFRYHEAKARGGWGLIITQDYAVEPRGKGYSHIPALWEDGQIEPHAELPRRVHRYGSKIFAQIYHAGRQSNREIMGMQPVAPSPIPCPTKKAMPHPLTEEEIRDIIRKFGDTALRARKAGFDGVEIHGAHGYLVAQFLSAYSNKRTDQYGGSIFNRARFALEIIRDIRLKAGNDYPIIFRISGDEFVPGGRTIEETKAVCMLLEDAGVDAIHVSAGVYGSRHRVVPPARMPHGHIVDHAAEVKSVVSVPVITVGWINDPIMAESIIRSGKADMVAMGRASLADPDLPNKTAAQRLEDIIYCIGCMQGCAEKIRKSGVAGGCMLNPLTGREDELAVTPTDTPRRVFVAGGGIAGMEAAIIAARRGHQVELFESKANLGGEFGLAAVAPGKGEIAGFIAWQTRELSVHGVQVHLNRALTAAVVGEERPDAVIVATGSTQQLPNIPGMDATTVVHAVDVLAGLQDTGNTVLIIGGGMVGSETANHLASHEKSVTLLEMTEEIALDEENNSRFLLLEDLKDHHVQIVTGARVTRLDGQVVHATRDGGEMTLGPFETIVVALGATAEQHLAGELETPGMGIPVTTVGDARGVRKALEAIEEGYRAGLTV
jgi:2,4-dienoyl-CoA reductase-like NADH-dependent reductase (Old Yellow Enzyme family)/thioredoxin reductase